MTPKPSESHKYVASSSGELSRETKDEDHSGFSSSSWQQDMGMSFQEFMGVSNSGGCWSALHSRSPLAR